MCVVCGGCVCVRYLAAKRVLCVNPLYPGPFGGIFSQMFGGGGGGDICK